MIKVLALCLAGAALSVSVSAQQPGNAEALQLLQKVSGAPQKVTYSGVFTYRSGSRSETSRITHLIDGSDEFEYLEALDGSPRQVVRMNEQVRCFLPENRLLIIEQRRSNRQLFPTLLPGSLAGLTEHYWIRKGPAGRVAGVDSQAVFVEPKDEFRYGHQFWIEPQSGLLLKAHLVDENGTPLETFSFTELKIGGAVNREAIKSQFALKNDDWRVQFVQASDAKGDDGQWVFRNTIPGFRRLSGMKRQLRPDAPESTQLVFSDGLAAISVFFEPMAGRGKEEANLFSMGAISVYRRQMGDYQLIVMGDVPAAVLRRLGDGIESRKR
jgi:sigma-E factor negative regulatory protein RseB